MCGFRGAIFQLWGGGGASQNTKYSVGFPLSSPTISQRLVYQIHLSIKRFHSNYPDIVLGRIYARIFLYLWFVQMINNSRIC